MKPLFFENICKWILNLNKVVCNSQTNESVYWESNVGVFLLSLFFINTVVKSDQTKIMYTLETPMVIAKPQNFLSMLVFV